MIVESNNLAGISTKQSINSSRNKKIADCIKKKPICFVSFAIVRIFALSI